MFNFFKKNQQIIYLQRIQLWALFVFELRSLAPKEIQFKGTWLAWAWFWNFTSICIAKHLGMHGMKGGTQVCSYVAAAEMAPGSLQGG